MKRLGYLDWLRGIAVLIMITAHTLDAWTRVDDRARTGFEWVMFVAGFGAPLFLFLAGAGLAMSIGRRLRAGATRGQAVARAARRGAEVFALAFLFRLQSMVISGGAWPQGLLKVDILNIMGLAMMAAAALAALSTGTLGRALTFAVGAVVVAMTTPLARTSELLAALPDPIEWYFRPAAGRTTFTLFPWSGFLLAGAAVGTWLEAATGDGEERRVNIWVGVLGATLALGGYLASFLPPLYQGSSFWTSSPTFSFVRAGVLMAAVPLAYLWARVARGYSPVQVLGVASLFVYWIHVEMVYGRPSASIHRRLPLELVGLAIPALIAFLYGLVLVKDRLARIRTPELAKSS